MHPLEGSPAILTGDDVTRTDQRGFTITGPPTIGAVQLGEVTVASDEAGLRLALTGSASSEGQVIRITSNITLGANGQLVVPGTADGLFLEAPGLTIDADGQSRVMEIQRGATTALHGLTFTGGLVSGNGGAILNDQATLSLSACTLSGNSAGDNGGGIFSDGRNEGSATLSLSACTLSGNSAGDNGGGIFSDGRNGSATLSLGSFTLSSNFAVTGGGGIFGTGGDEGSATLSLSACTLSGNSTREGGGILADSRNNGSTTLSLSDTILAGNIAVASGSDLRELGDGATSTATGNNLLSSLAGQNTLSGSDVTIETNPMLAPLGDFGGPTQTMPPLPGSPAINAGGSINPGGTDQRGFPRSVNGADIGAAEFQGNETELDLAFFEDIDGDGTAVGVELAIGTDPLVADASGEANLRLTIDQNGEPNFTFGVDSAQSNDIILRLMRSTGLETFEVIDSNLILDFPISSMTGLANAEDSSPPAGGKAFYRLEAVRRP